MRLDKYLKVSRLIKRRTVAKSACDGDRIEVNGKIARASLEVHVGDKITLNLGSAPFSVEVLSLKEHVLKDDVAELYKIVE